jgi:hypothetical protein
MSVTATKLCFALLGSMTADPISFSFSGDLVCEIMTSPNSYLGKGSTYKANGVEIVLIHLAKQ